MFSRTAQRTALDLARGFPILAITGPRQSGKTTLARALFPERAYLTLEDPDQREFASHDPRGFLARFADGAIIDEAQHCPDLFSYLQGLVDARRRMGDFILTGSQQFGLVSRITQSLAGRVGLVQLLPFSLVELADAAPQKIGDRPRFNRFALCNTNPRSGGGFFWCAALPTPTFCYACHAVAKE